MIQAFGREWYIIESFMPSDEDWKVIANSDGELWMNNCEGYMVFVQNSGVLLKSLI